MRKKILYAVGIYGKVEFLYAYNREDAISQYIALHPNMADEEILCITADVFFKYAD